MERGALIMTYTQVRNEHGRIYPNGLLSRVRRLGLDEHFTLLFEASKPDERGCRIWIGSKTTEGYGRLVKKGKRYLASRLAYERFKGPVPEGLEACHSCDNPSCVEPDHLFAGTTKDNALDRQAKGRGNHEIKRIAFRVRDPSGKAVEGFFLTKFCVEHGLLQSKMSDVLRGARKHHKGWTRYG
jgi:HNH endonuclease